MSRLLQLTVSRVSRKIKGRRRLRKKRIFLAALMALSVLLGAVQALRFAIAHSRLSNWLAGSSCSSNTSNTPTCPNGNDTHDSKTLATGDTDRAPVITFGPLLPLDETDAESDNGTPDKPVPSSAAQPTNRRQILPAPAAPNNASTKRPQSFDASGTEAPLRKPRSVETGDFEEPESRRRR